MEHGNKNNPESSLGGGLPQAVESKR